MTPTASIQSTGALPKGRACTPAQYRRTAAAQTPRHALAIAHAAGLGTHRELRPGGVFGPRGIGAVLLAVATAVACVWSTPAEAETSAGSQEPQVLVGNLDVGDGGSGGIQRTLGAARSGFGQAFTTGPTTGGYALGSLGIQVSQFSDGSTAGDDLRVTVNGVADGGGPGAALCTLTHPSSFQAPGVSTFGAPAGEDACPQLAKETTYFAVIEWIEPDEAGRLAVIPQTFPTDESAASDEDPGGAQGWSIADVSWYLTVASGARTWTAYETTASFKIRLQEAAVAAIVANRPAAGLPTISGTAQVGETLTASVAGIGDADGLDNAVFSHQWIRTGGTGTATDIEGATGSTYAPVAADAGATIAVRVTFEDDGGTRETLLSAATETVAAAPEEVESTALGVLSVADAEASEEEDATLDFAVTLDPAADAAVTVDYATSDGTATSGADYTGTSGTLTFLAGETAKTVSVPIIDDAVDDGGETLTLTLANAAGAEIGAAAATGIIRDDDGNRLSVADAEASEEEDATLDFAVTLDPAADAAVTVDYATSDGTATSGADYTGTSGTLTFLAGETAKTVSVPIIDDAVDDGGETLTLTLANAAGAEIGAAAATGIIRDDDGNRLSVADAEASEEEDATLDFAVTLDPAADAAVTVDYATSDGTATSGADYTGTSGTLTFLAGETAKTVSVPIIDDAVDDGGETLTLTLANAAGAEIGAAAATGIIRDDDGNRLSVADAEASEEEDATLDFAVTLDPAADAAVTVDYATSDGTATSGADYTGTSGTLTFLAGETAKTVSVPIIDDAVDDGGETLTLTLSQAAGANIGAAAATGIIRDDDGNRLTVADAEASEEEDATLDFAVTLDPAADAAVTVDYATSDGTATSGADYTGTSGTLTFLAGETAKTVSVPIIDDAVDDGGETLTLTLSQAAGANIGTAAATGIIRDDDGNRLTASFENVPDEHDGGNAFVFRVAFSEEVGISYATLRDESFSTTDGDVTAARRVDGRHDLWEITVEPDSRAAVSITLPGNRACGTTGAVCTRGDDPSPLGNSPSATVAGPPTTPLTASFGDMPATHAGEEFEFRLTFSEEPEVSYVTLRDHAFDETGGTVRKAKRRTQGSNLSWDITVKPNGVAAVTIELPATTDCAATGAICTHDERPLSNAPSATVAGASTASAVVDGPTLTLSWPTLRDGFAAPHGADFAVRVDGSLRTVSSASLWTHGSVLLMAEPVLAGEEVVVDYLGSAMHALSDAAGRTEPAWRDLAAVNVTGLAEAGADALPTEGAAWAIPVDALSLNLAGRELDDAGLAALAARTDLRRLDLSGNGLTDLSALAPLRALRSLDLSGNAVSDLSPLAGMTELRRLDLAGNRVVDLWPLGALPHLEVLLLDGNDVADVGALTHLGRLENLGLAGNLVADVGPLADLWSLRRLDLGGNPAPDLSPVGDLETLVWLRLPSAGGEAPTHRLVRLRWLLAPNAAGVCLGCGDAAPGHAEAR